ncbi:MAG TPA: peptidase M13, partial [Intrasporangium sp.]|nr:peptidase M13 [Intrasporangium sp.]
MISRSGIDLASLDRTVRPQDDLFRFVNGTWLDTTEIPADRARFGAFDLLREQSTTRVHQLIEEAAARASTGEGAQQGSAKRQVGDLFASFMDTDRVEELGLSPLLPMLAEVAGIDSVDALAATLGRLHRVGVTGLLALYVSPDQRAPEDYADYLEQAGLGLPDESYYRGETYADIRVAYVAHVEWLLGLAGIPEAPDKAARIMALETRLALHHWDKVANRDAIKTYNAYT